MCKINGPFIAFLLSISLAFFRSEYFKTALNTAVGGQKSTIKVEECSFKVLSAIIGFMYGKSLVGGNLDWEEATSLLLMADFFLMGDLKDAAIPVIENLLSLEHLLEAAELAVKQSNEKLKEVCCDFALSRIPPGDHSNDLLQKLILILPMFGLRAWHRSYVATKVLGIEQRSPLKSRKDFLDSSYPDYIREHLKPNMLVVCNQESDWQGITVPVGSVGRVIKLVRVRGMSSFWFETKALVKWSRLGEARPGKVEFLDILTLPIQHEMLDMLVD